MLDLTNIEEQARRAFAKAAAVKPWVTRQAQRVYRVVGRSSANDKYTVEFFVEDGRRKGECRRLDGQPCPAHAQGKFCYHLTAAYRRHLSNARRDRDRRPQQPMEAIAA